MVEIPGVSGTNAGHRLWEQLGFGGFPRLLFQDAAGKGIGARVQQVLHYVNTLLN
jgi:hypothetical protein